MAASSNTDDAEAIVGINVTPLVDITLVLLIIFMVTATYVAKDADARAIISADKGALHGAVVRVIDLVRGAGVTRFAIHVEKER